MEEIVLSRDAFAEAILDSFNHGRQTEREIVAKWLERLVEYPCMRPDWLQIAHDVRKGLADE